jgi:hypothetical protein
MRYATHFVSGSPIGCFFGYISERLLGWEGTQSQAAPGGTVYPRLLRRFSGLAEPKHTLAFLAKSG